MSLIRYQTPGSVRWPSLNRWASLRDDLDTLLELPFLTGGARQAQLFTGWTPALDLYQNTDNVVAVIELPGMRKEDIEISLHDGMLTIGGERKTEAGENGESATRTERFSGKFRRSITLPGEVNSDKVTADYANGVLTVKMEKAPTARSKRIEVKTS